MAFRSVVRAWRALERLSEGPFAVPAVFVAALVVYAVVSIAFPLAAGRDVFTYLRVYVQLFDADAVYPQAMLARTPLSPLVIGWLLELGGLLAELAMALVYALSIVAWCAVARRLGAAAVVLTAVALLAFPGYAMLFHRLSTDALFAAGFAFTAPLLARAVERPTVVRAAALGGAVAGLVFLRPSSQVFLAFVLVPLLAAGPWRARLGRTGAFVAAAVLPLGVWAVHNQLRFDDLTVARGGSATVPFFRTYVNDRIVSTDNGPASAELARAVEDDLLGREPYRSYGVTLDEFFRLGSGRMHEDLIGLADRTWGWDDDYAQLSSVAREAIRAHPSTYARNVVRDIGVQLRAPLLLEVQRSGGGGAGSAPPPEETIVVNGRRLPRPTEGDIIPAAHQAGLVSTPDGSISEVWTSPTEHRIVFREPEDALQAAKVEREMGRLGSRFPDRSGSAPLGDALNWASRLYPRSVLLLFVGAVALALRRPRGWATPAALAGAALLLGIVTMLGVYPVPEYLVPVAPAFVLLAAAGLVGERAPAVASSRLHRQGAPDAGRAGA